MVFVDKINILLREGVFTKEEIHNAGMSFVKGCEDDEEVIKFALTCCDLVVKMKL